MTQLFKRFSNLFHRKEPARSVMQSEDRESRLTFNFTPRQRVWLPAISPLGAAQVVLKMAARWPFGAGQAVEVTHSLTEIQVTAKCELAQSGLAIVLTFRNLDPRLPIRGDSIELFQFTPPPRSRLRASNHL